MTRVRRDDIQGLRAIAICSVVLFHMNAKWLPGGFVGVDLFFVISGFLITSKLFDEAKTSGTVSVFSFWRRRARRLVPNSTLVLLFIIVASVFLLPSYRQVIVSGDVISAVLLAANYRFSTQAIDYFSADLLPSPALHFWSLSIEQHYYIFAPVALFLIAKCKRLSTYHWELFLWCVFVISFIYCIYLTTVSQPLAYFSTFARAWQFAAGGLLGFHIKNFDRINVQIMKSAAMFAVSAVFLSFVFLDNMNYPGSIAFLPTLSSVLMIITGEKVRLLNSVLSVKPMVWIGNRSYSIYLWHWPIIVFFPAVSPIGTIMQVLLFMLFAEIAYRLTERPYKAGKRFVLPMKAGLVLVSSQLLILFGAGALNHGLGGQSERDRLVSLARSDTASSYKDGCHQGDGGIAVTHCEYGGTHASIVLFGDSRAAQWLSAISKAAKYKGDVVWSLTKSNCPSADVTVFNEQTRVFFEECKLWREAALSAIVADDAIKIVIVSENLRYFYKDANGELCPDRAACREIWIEGFVRTMKRLRASGKQVVFINDTPIARQDVLDCLASEDAVVCGSPRSTAGIDFNVAAVLRERLSSEVRLLDVTDKICSGSLCPAERDGLIVYRDFEHLTSTFSESLWREFLPILPSEARKS